MTPVSLIRSELFEPWSWVVCDSVRESRDKMSVSSTLCFVFVLVAGVTGQVDERTSLRTIFDLILNIGRDYYYETNSVASSNQQSRYDCPLCDSSVYSYCSDKLLHDACCCLNPYEHRLPYQCKYADCNFLHANSCQEHKLITACCCSRLFDKKRGSIFK